MIARRSALAALAASFVALAAFPASAQETPASAPDSSEAPRETLNGVSPETLAWASNFVASTANQIDLMMEELGLDSPGVELALTPEMVAASIPTSGASDDAGFLRMEADFEVRDERTATSPPERPFNYVLATEAQECLQPGGSGEIVHFRALALDQAKGHLCVVAVEDGAGLWALWGRGLAVAGDLKLLANYYLVIEITGQPERAREIGRTAQEGMVRVSSVLADYTLAAASVGQNRPTDDPVELARRMGDVLERMTAAAVANLPPPADGEDR